MVNVKTSINGYGHGHGHTRFVFQLDRVRMLCMSIPNSMSRIPMYDSSRSSTFLAARSSNSDGWKWRKSEHSSNTKKEATFLMTETYSDKQADTITTISWNSSWEGSARGGEWCTCISGPLRLVASIEGRLRNRRIKIIPRFGR